MALQRNDVVRVTRGETFAGESDLKVMVCASCAVLYAVPARLLDKAREDPRREWWCPNGHSQHFPGKTPEQREAELRDRIAAERARSDQLKARGDQLKASLSAQRAATTRARNEKARLISRVANGVCPCCTRTFKQLARHMASQHPEYLADTDRD